MPTGSKQKILKNREFSALQVFQDTSDNQVTLYGVSLFLDQKKAETLSFSE